VGFVAAKDPDRRRLQGFYGRRGRDFRLKFADPVDDPGDRGVDPVDFAIEAIAGGRGGRVGYRVVGKRVPAARF
jgi:hypothetical protein